MGNEPHKDDEQLKGRFLINISEEDKALFAQFAKDQKMSLAKFFRTAGKEYMVGRGYLNESIVLGVSEKAISYRIVRVPIGENNIFQLLVSHLKSEGYALLGKSFKDKSGCIMQLMANNKSSASKNKG
jgi:hypothetical protein